MGFPGSRPGAGVCERAEMGSAGRSAQPKLTAPFMTADLRVGHIVPIVGRGAMKHKAGARPTGPSVRSPAGIRSCPACPEAPQDLDRIVVVWIESDRPLVAPDGKVRISSLEVRFRQAVVGV